MTVSQDDWPVLEGEGFVLRVLKPEDAAAWHAGEDEEQRRWFEFPGPAPFENVVRAIASWRKSWSDGGPVRHWGIWTHDELAGGIEVRDRRDGRANVSHLVFPFAPASTPSSGYWARPVPRCGTPRARTSGGRIPIDAYSAVGLSSKYGMRRPEACSYFGASGHRWKASVRARSYSSSRNSRARTFIRRRRIQTAAAGSPRRFATQSTRDMPAAPPPMRMVPSRSRYATGARRVRFPSRCCAGNGRCTSPASMTWKSTRQR